MAHLHNSPEYVSGKIQPSLHTLSQPQKNKSPSVLCTPRALPLPQVTEPRWIPVSRPINPLASQQLYDLCGPAWKGEPSPQSVD